MTTLNVVIIHGIGRNGPGFSKDLTDGISRAFNHVLTRSLNTNEDYARKHLNFIEIVWDDILAENQAKLADIFRKEFDRRRGKETFNIIGWVVTLTLVTVIFSFIFKSPLLFVCLALFAFLVGKIIVERIRSAFAAEFINDIISYRDPNAKALIQKRIETTLIKLVTPPQTIPVTFVAHSLGTVIASDYIWERQKPGKLFDKKLALANLFTMGSPMPLFSLQFGGPEIFTKPISVQVSGGVWVNVYDNDDPIAYPLKNLNEAYDKAVATDFEVNVGWLGLSHLNYWKSQKVHEIIAAKLAQDWLKEQQ